VRAGVDVEVVVVRVDQVVGDGGGGQQQRSKSTMMMMMMVCVMVDWASAEELATDAQRAQLLHAPVLRPTILKPHLPHTTTAYIYSSSPSCMGQHSTQRDSCPI